MKRTTAARWWVVALVLIAGLATVACEGEGEEPTPTPSGPPPTKTLKIVEIPSQPPTKTPEPTPEPAYVNPELLVSTEWLAEHAGDADLVIADARKKDAYDAGHIPGAVSLPREVTFAPAPPKNLVATPEEVAKVLGELGIGNDTRVVIYDEGKSNRGARIFWTLEYHGHTKAALLDGGFAKWEAEERSVVTDVPEIVPQTFVASVKPTLLSTMDQITADIGAEGVVIVDARSPAEYSGEDVRTKRGGHIPGAVNIDWRENFTEADAPLWLPPAELLQLYEDQGVTSDKVVHAY